MASVASSLKCKSSSVALWLDDIENVEPAATGIVKCSRKRRRDDNHQHLASLPKCRRAPMNDMSTGTPHTPVHRRSTRRRKEPPPKTFQSYDDDNEEPTPRPSSPGVLTRAPNLEPTESTASEASSRSCTHSSPSRSSVSRRFRASSPRKIATPAATAQQILYQRYIPSQEKRIQIVAQEMIKNIAKYAKGRGVISESAHAVIQARDTEDDFADANFEHDRERLGECPTLDHADLLVGDTIRCHEMHESEAAWNCESHHPIGKTACRMSAHHKSIHWQNLYVSSRRTNHEILLQSLTSSSILKDNGRHRLVNSTSSLHQRTVCPGDPHRFCRDSHSISTTDAGISPSLAVTRHVYDELEPHLVCSYYAHADRNPCRDEEKRRRQPERRVSVGSVGQCHVRSITTAVERLRSCRNTTTSYTIVDCRRESVGVLCCDD